MAMQTAKSGLAARLNDKAKQSFEKNKSKVETPMDMGEMPGGVSGIARLVRIGFTPITEVKPTDKHGGKVGDYWFTAMGVVVEPQWCVDGKGNKVRIAGKQTRLIEACFDQPVKPGASERARFSQEDHLEWIQRQIKFLMPGNSLGDYTVNDLEMVCEILTKQKPYFAFSTSEGEPNPQYPKPRVFHNWNGRVDDFNPTTADVSAGQVKDNSAAKSQPSTNGSHASGQPAQNTQASQPVNRVANVAPTPNEEFDEFGDIDSLVQRAGDGDEDAGAELTQLAIKAGVPEEDVKTAQTWDDVAVLIKDKQSDSNSFTTDDDNGSSGDDEPQKVITPKLGTVYRYKGKGMKNPVDVECVKVNTKSSKCNLKNMATEKVYEDVPFAEVLPPA